MKSHTDLVRGWLKKAKSDVIAMNASISAGALDVACFHAQQSAEKYLKAFLSHSKMKFPFTHNLSKLVELCAKVDVRFGSLQDAVELLTPYAVELRYDDDFWPSSEVAIEARSASFQVQEVVAKLLPSEITQDL